MKKIDFKAVAAFLMIVPLIVVLSSCSDDDYLNAIPENSTALVSIDVPGLLEFSNAGNVQNVMSEVLGIDATDDCGIDFTSRLYLFETIEGNIGLAAKLSDEDALGKCLDKSVKAGRCKPVSEYRGYSFSVINDSWVAGYSSNAIVVLGPALPSAQAELRQRIAKYLEQDEKHGIKTSPMFSRIDSIQGSVAFVCQAAALPDKFAGLFSLGAPKDADASQVLLAAELDTSVDDLFIIRGETFSLNKRIDSAIRDSKSIFRPIENDFVANVADSSALVSFMNVDGKEFIRLLHSSRTFQALLAGMNMAVDMDNIIRGINGDFVITVPDFIAGKPSLQIGAELGSKSFLEDVSYWKESCPKGTEIRSTGKDEFCYTGGDISFCFGVNGMRFYAGSSVDNARAMLSTSNAPVSSVVKNVIKGQRLVIVANLNSLIGSGSGMNGYFQKLLGNKRRIIYIMK